MKKPSKFIFFTSSTATFTHYTFPNNTTEAPPPPPLPPQKTEQNPVPVPTHFSQPDAATRIQSAYRGHRIRSLYAKISSVSSEADALQREIQRQETVDAIRSSEKERLRVNEALMGLLLRLDSVPGVDPTVREARRKVSRRIVGMQEIVDAICQAGGRDDDRDGGGWWDLLAVMEEMEEKVCRERGGEEMERFCAQYLGFRCLQRFLREP